MDSGDVIAGGLPNPPDFVVWSNKSKLAQIIRMILVIINIFLIISRNFEVQIQIQSKTIKWDARVLCNGQKVTGTLVAPLSSPQPYPLFLVVNYMEPSVLDAIHSLNPVGIVLFEDISQEICSALKNVAIVYFSPKTRLFFNNLIGQNANLSLREAEPTQNWFKLRISEYFIKFLLPLSLVVFMLVVFKFCKQRIGRTVFYLRKKMFERKLRSHVSLFPVETYKDKSEELFCSICICEVVEGEVLRRMPCKHRFHKECIDPWLLVRKNCPLCQRRFFSRSGILPSFP